VWASGSNIVNASNSNVEIRITPTDTAAGTAGTTTTFTVDNFSPYSVQSITDPDTGNIEYQMFYNDFQFGTIVQTPAGAVGFRGHPDQNDIDGWGTTVWENVYITGSGVDATGGAVNSATAGTSGIQVSAGGDVPSAAGSAGSWNWTSTITYDPVQETVSLTGSTTVTLAATLSGDMNIGRHDSNYLYAYSLNGGGVGPTGDMKSVSFIYGPDSSVSGGQWTPLPGAEGTSPQDASDDLTTIVWGQINKSDPNLVTVAKPTVERELVSADPTTKLIVACNWDSTQVGYQYDNIGVEQIVRPQNTTATTFTFQNTENWTLPDTTSPTATVDPQTTNINTPVLTGTVNSSSPSKPIIAVQIVIPGVTTTPLMATVTDTTWSVADSTTLLAGTYDVQATVTDADGNTAFATATLTIESQVTWQDTIGLFSPTPSTFYLRNTNDAGFANQTFVYGPANTGWKPIAGDWNKDGIGTIGLFNPTTSVFYLRNTNDSGYADLTFQYGPVNSGWLPIAGDWNRDGQDTIGLYNPTTSVFYLRNTNDAGYADLTFQYGPANSGWLPIVGDWDHDGMDTIGLYSPSTAVVYLRNTNDAGYADLTFAYGPAGAGWKPVAGDWNADGTDTIGIYSPTTSVFYLRNTNDAGYANQTFSYGPANAGWQPIVCDWNGPASPLRVAGGAIATDSAPLSQSALQPIVSEAIARWAAAGMSASSLATLNNVKFVIADLPGSYLGLADANTICIDRDAAGHGWFIDPTPALDEEFTLSSSDQQLRAIDPRAVDRIDLLSVVEHELGHIAGLNYLDASVNDLMNGLLGTGIRRNASQVDAVLAFQ
jgi:hypothetical protein